MIVSTARLKEEYSDEAMAKALGVSAEGLRQLKETELEVKAAEGAELCYIRPKGSAEQFRIVARELIDLPQLPMADWRDKAAETIKSLFGTKYISRDLQRQEKKEYADKLCIWLRGANGGEYKTLDILLNRSKRKIFTNRFQWWTFAGTYADKDKIVPMIVLVISKNKQA